MGYKVETIIQGRQCRAYDGGDSEGASGGGQA